MAKGRKIAVSTRSELLLGYSQNLINTDASSELGEEDVWSMIDDVVDQDHHLHHSGWSSNGSVTNEDCSLRSQRWISNQDRQIGGLSLAFDEVGRSVSPRILHQYHGKGNENKAPQRGRHVASSAPVNVPNWSKIYRVDSVESIHDSDDGTDDYDSERVPPHEYLARSRNSAATSIFEGVGRTLKGRDMSRVRDAVWSQTGFDG